MCLVILLFILFMGFSRQEYRSGLPFPSPVDHFSSELSAMTHPTSVAQAINSMAHSSIRLWSIWSVWLVFCDCGFHSVCPLIDRDKRVMEASWSLSSCILVYFSGQNQVYCELRFCSLMKMGDFHPILSLQLLLVLLNYPFFFSFSSTALLSFINSGSFSNLACWDFANSFWETSGASCCKHAT